MLNKNQHADLLTKQQNYTANDIMEYLTVI